MEEEKFDSIENFTSLTQIAINQEFFDIILTNNICSLVMSDVMEEKLVYIIIKRI